MVLTNIRSKAIKGQQTFFKVSLKLQEHDIALETHVNSWSS